MKREKNILPVILSIVGVIALFPLTGCSATDKYHNKRKMDIIGKDVDAVHKDIDNVLGLDASSPLLEKE
ncbi:MAG TPA: hypothetical protein ACFYDZ_09020 [Candidatus Brocadiaceae bacterium]